MALVLFGLLEFDSGRWLLVSTVGLLIRRGSITGGAGESEGGLPEVEQTQWRNCAQSKTDPPCGAQMVFTCGQHDDHGDEVGDDEAETDLEVGGEDEPAVAVAAFELTGGLGGADGACWAGKALAGGLAVVEQGCAITILPQCQCR